MPRINCATRNINHHHCHMLHSHLSSADVRICSPRRSPLVVRTLAVCSYVGEALVLVFSWPHPPTWWTATGWRHGPVWWRSSSSSSPEDSQPRERSSILCACVSVWVCAHWCVRECMHELHIRSRRVCRVSMIISIAPRPFISAAWS